MEIKTIIMVVLALLLIFAAVQAYQISSMKSKVTGTSSGITTASAPAPSSAPASSGMVGGC